MALILKAFFITTKYTKHIKFDMGSVLYLRLDISKGLGGQTLLR